MNEVTAIVQLKVDPHPKDPEWLELRLLDTLMDVIYGNRKCYPILRRVAEVVEVKVLKPGQGYIHNPSGLTGKTEEIVDEPAAAGEAGVETVEVTIPLHEEQRERAKLEINSRLLYPVIRVEGALVCRRSNTLVAWCLTHGRSWQWITLPLPSESIDRILG